MTQPLVLLDTSDPSVTIITLNRPQKRNALSIQLMESLRDAVRTASANQRCRVLILRANGPAFCAGFDLAEVAGGSEKSAQALADLYKDICLSRLVTIAAAQGAVMGGGVGLLSACDLVVAADNVQIGFPEVRRGLVAALVTALVRRQINDRPLREFILLGQTINAAHALAIGLLNRVVPPDHLLNEATDWARQAKQGAPKAITRTKQLLDELASRPIATELDRALLYHLEARDAAEAAEGIAAFLEKREPRWGPL